MNQNSFIYRQKSASYLKNLGISLNNYNRAFSSSQKNNHNSLSKKCAQENNYSFKPQIHDIPMQIYSRTLKTQCSKEDIFERLINNQNKKKSQFQRQKLKQQQDHLNNFCTFQPKISQNSKKIAEQSLQPKSAIQRLYANAVQKIRSKQADISIIENNKENYPFQPKVDPYPYLNSQKRDLRPLHQRIKDIIQEKHKNLKILREKDFYQKSEKFINQKTNQIIQNKKDFKKDVLQRFQNYLIQKKRKNQIKQWQQDIKNNQQCTFKPNIGSNVMIKDQSSSFISRQQQFSDLLRQKLDYKIGQMLRQNFKPQINKVSDLLVRADRQNQTQQQKIERLIIQPIIQKQRKILKVAQQAYKECTFQPQINTISKALKARHVNHVCSCTPQPQKHQFKPKINANSSQLAQKHKKSNSQLIKSNISNKIKMDNQYKEFKQCTFKPQINQGSKARSGSLSSVKGLDILNRKIQMIKNKKEYQSKIKEKLFNMEKKYQPRKKTEIEQFKLSQGCNNIQKTKKQREQQFYKECTFQPSINQLR